MIGLLGRAHTALPRGQARPPRSGPLGLIELQADDEGHHQRRGRHDPDGEEQRPEAVREREQADGRDDRQQRDERGEEDVGRFTGLMTASPVAIRLLRGDSGTG